MHPSMLELPFNVAHEQSLARFERMPAAARSK
jgi:hypothetical protein